MTTLILRRFNGSLTPARAAAFGRRAARTARHETVIVDLEGTTGLTAEIAVALVIEIRCIPRDRVRVVGLSSAALDAFPGVWAELCEVLAPPPPGI